MWEWSLSTLHPTAACVVLGGFLYLFLAERSLVPCGLGPERAQLNKTQRQFGCYTQATELTSNRVWFEPSLMEIGRERLGAEMIFTMLSLSTHVNEVQGSKFYEIKMD